MLDRLEGELAHQVGVAGVAKTEVSVGIDVDDLERRRLPASLDRLSPQVEQLVVVLDHEAWPRPIQLASLRQEGDRLVNRPRWVLLGIEALLGAVHEVGLATHEEVEIYKTADFRGLL